MREGGSLTKLLKRNPAYLHSNERNSGEGVARLGISRRVLQSGWTLDVEFLIPFRIGLEQSHLSRGQVLLNIGRRFSWKNAAGPQTSPPTDQIVRYGTVEGVVQKGDIGVKGLRILIDGEPRAVSGSKGEFRIIRVPTGAASVSLDVRQIDLNESVVDGISHEVIVPSDGAARADFRLISSRYFQGAVILYQEGKQVPLRGVAIQLIGKDYKKTVVTSGVGGFQFDDVPPGIYRILLNAKAIGHGIAPEIVPSYGIVLTQDVLGYLIKIKDGN